MKFSDLLDGNKLKVLNYSGGCATCSKKLVGFTPPVIKGTSLIFVGAYPTDTSKLEYELGKHGITDYSYTTVVHCACDKTPTDKIISNCMSQYTMQEVTGYPTIVLLGTTAIKAFFPNERVQNLRGNVVWHQDFPGQRFFCTYGAGYARDAESRKEWDKALSRLSRILKEDPNPPWKIYDGDTDFFLEKLNKILSKKMFTFDIETNSLYSWHPTSKIRSFSVCAGEDEALFCSEGDLVWENALYALVVALEDPTKTVVGHNVGFDVEYLEAKRGAFTQCRLLDTMSLYYLLKQERMPSLKYLTAKYLDGYRYLVPNPDTCEDMDLLGKYNAEDVIRTWQLAKQGYPLLTKKQKDLLLRVASPSGLALRRLQTTGFYFDLEIGKETQAQIKEEKDAIVSKWQAEDPTFCPDSHLEGDGLIWYLYDHRGLPIINTTDTGKPSTDKHTLGLLQRQESHEYLTWLGRIKTLSKIDSTYIEKYVNGELVDQDQRVHGSYFNTFTKTGRSNSRAPNMQNYSRDDTLQKSAIEGVSKPLSVRKFFTVPEGKTLLHSDYSQLELRLAMALANDPTGLAAYRDGGDLHTLTAQMIAAGENRDATKLDRVYAKPVNFGLIYCHKNEAYTLKKNAAREYGLDITDQQSEKYVETFFSTYTHIRRWQKQTVQRLRANQGWAETILGHKWHYPEYNSGDKNKRDAAEREAINIQCQGPAGYLTLYTLYIYQQLLRERGFTDVKVVGSVHDSILSEVPDSQLKDAIGCLNDAVAQVCKWISPWFKIPLEMDHEIGPNWSRLSSVEALD